MKKIIYSFLITLVIFTDILYADITTNLVAHYELENNTLDTSSTNDANLSGDGNYTTGVLGQALSLNGVDNAIETPLYLDQNSGVDINYTISLWLKPSRTDEEVVFSTDNGGYDWGLLKKNNRWYIFNGSNTYDTSIDVVLDSWQHLVVQYDTTNSLMYLYIDGEKVYSNTISYEGSFHKLWFGVTPYNNSSFFQGMMDDIRIYERVLSHEDIFTLYSNKSKLSTTLTINNLIINDHNISKVTYYNKVLSYDFDISGLVDGNNSLTTDVFQDINYSVSITRLESDVNTTYYYDSCNDRFDKKYKSDGCFDSTSLTRTIDMSGKDFVDSYMVLFYSFNHNDTSDESLYINDGNLSGSGTYNSGFIGNALYFNGTDSYIQTPVELNQTSGTLTSYTVSLWLKPEENGEQRIFSSDDGGWDWHIYIKNNTYWYSNGSNGYDTGVSVEYDIWQHLLVSFDTQNSLMDIYLNGKLIKNSSISYDSSFNNLHFAANNYSSYFYKGYLDEIKVFEKAFSEAEAINLFEQAPSLNISFNLNNLVLADHNVTSAKLINGYDQQELDITDLSNVNKDVIDTKRAYSLQIDTNTSGVVESWWYNFLDGKIYERNNGSSEFQSSFTVDTSITIDSSTANWINETLDLPNTFPMITSNATQYLNILYAIPQESSSSIVKSKDENYLFVTYIDRLAIYDISDSRNMVALSSATLSTNTQSSNRVILNSDESKAFLGRADGKVTVVDISNKNAPVQIAEFDHSGEITDLALSVDETKLFVLDGTNLKTIDITDIANTSELYAFSASGAKRFTLKSNGTFIHILHTSNNSIETVLVNSSGDLSSEHNITLPTDPNDAKYSVNDEFLYVTSGLYFHSLKVNTNGSLELLDSIYYPNSSIFWPTLYGLVIDGDKAYTPYNVNYQHQPNILEFDISNP